jgi:asparagine synthase (glutamine-hydrolysing)
MCGLFGVISNNVSSLLSSRELDNILLSLRHRGPDGSGTWLDKNAGIHLGHRRLSIHDLSSHGNQPMLSKSNRYVLVYNGEIYNFVALRKKLVLDGCIFEGGSDTEVLLNAIDKWGLSKSLNLFNGMFAFALWDRKKRQLLMIRDRMGEKPLYYGWQGDAFLFGSELKAFLQHPAWVGGVNRNSLAKLLQYNYIPSPQTIYHNIFQVQPGEMVKLSFQNNAWNLEASNWWSLSENFQKGKDNLFQGNRNDAVDELELILKEVLSEQQLADVPVGAFLSGGIDSSAVVSVLQSVSSQPINSFTIGSFNPDYDESTKAREIAKQLNVNHTEYKVDVKDVVNLIPQIPNIYDEPFADASQIPTILISRLAKQKVTVAISGDGGDEIFGGYNRYIVAPRLFSWLEGKPLFLRRLARNMITSISPQLWDMINFSSSHQLGEKAHKISKLLDAKSEWEIYSRLIKIWHESIPVLGYGIDSDISYNFENEDRFSYLDKAGSFSEKMMLADAATYLPDDILVKVDRAAMNSSLETRVPLLDYRVVSFASTLPLDMKIYNGESKWILRQLIDRYLPRSLVNYPKSGFAIPLHEWLRGPLRDWAESLLNLNRLEQEGFFDPLPIRKLWNEHLSGKFNHQYALWSVLMFQAWLELQ